MPAVLTVAVYADNKMQGSLRVAELVLAGDSRIY